MSAEEAGKVYPLRLELADNHDRKAGEIEAKAACDAEKMRQAAIAAGKPVPERQLAALRLQARQRAEVQRRFAASWRRTPSGMTDAKLVERYAARVGADLSAPDALTTLCADLIRRHHPEVAEDWWDDRGVWDEDHLLYLVHDVDAEGDGPELARIEQMLCKRPRDYPGETVHSLQERLQEARRRLGISAPRGRPPRTG